LELLDRIEGMDKKAIDAVATLKRWALMVDPHQVPTVAQALVRRGDRTLVPAVRQMMRDGGGGAAEVIWFMIRHGNAEDFRFLRLALQHDLANGAPLGSSRVYGPASSGLRDSTSPLAVPLLVDLLGQRQITGSRWVSEIKAARGFSCADSSIEALIRLTGHNEGYQSGDDDQQRFTAIDRWQAWWQREGRAAYVKKHPEVLRVLEGDERPVGDLGTRKLPPLVRVTASDLKSPLSYDVPRADVAALLKTGAIEGRESPKGEVSFRFTSPQAAEKWFAAARVVPAAKKAAPKAVFTRLCREDFRGPAFAPDGRAWFWLAESDIPTVTAKKQVEAAFRGKEPYISGVETLLVDRSGRVWLIPCAQRQVLLGYDPATKEWTERRCTPESLGKKPANAREAQMTSPLFEDRAGRLYFPDHLGVHVLDGKTWSYQPLFARNIKEQRYESDWRSFNEPQFVQDTEGRVYAWSLWASRGWTGTIGYWVFDGRKWTNDAGVEHLRHVLPRTRDEVWLITEKQQFAVQRGGKLLTGEEAQKALFPHLRFESLWCVGTGADGTACLQLLNVTENTTFIRSTTRSVLVPPSGAARDLGQNGRTFFDGCTQGDVAFGPNGWLWTGAGGKVRRLSPDGKDLLVLEGPRRFSEPQLRAVDGKGQLYVTGSGHVWRCLPHEAQTVQETGEPLFPAMRARCLERVCQDSQGRLWCTWDIPDPPGAVFTGTTWRTFGGRRDLGPHGFSSAFPGAGGTLVLQEPYAFRLFDAKGMVEARSLPDLLKQHGERVAACLTCPPQPSIPAYSHLIKDGKGRFWWANWEHDWGVVDGGKLIDGKAAKLGIGPKSGGRRFVILTPIGAGGRVLAVDDSGATAILDVMDGHLVKLADAPKTHFDDHHYRRQRPLHDGAGRVWLVGYIGGSVAIDADGKIAARHAGKLLLEDSRRGLWFQVASNRTTSLVRLDPAGRELRLAVPDLLESAPLAEAPDGTLWTLTTSHLVRLRAEAERLKVVERYPLRVSARDTLWCDGLGRVWHLHEPWSSGRQERHLICYATLLP
ncbi:MAG TPA: hypothetical protein VEL76_38905, partial [Gemmataceae bacterium]|nr:hypothetical protein [Gemmataceae bacterium]